MKSLRSILRRFKEYLCLFKENFCDKVKKLVLTLSSKNSKPIDSSAIVIPNNIIDEESIARAIYSPVNLNKKKDGLNNNFYKPKAGEDEISVNRLDYTTPIFLKNLAKKTENAPIRNFFGFSILKALEIRDCQFDVVYSPIKEVNPYHSDIKIGYRPEKGKPIDSYISSQIKKMTDMARFYDDPNISSEKWEGKELS